MEADKSSRPLGVGSSEGLGPLSERVEVERLARWLEAAAFSDQATSFHEYEQAARALRALQFALDAAVAAERERCYEMVADERLYPSDQDAAIVNPAVRRAMQRIEAGTTLDDLRRERSGKKA